MSRTILRLVVAYGMGAFFLAESFNPDFWRPHIAAWEPFVRLSVALFGAAWLIQAVVLHRQFRNQKG